MSVQQEIKPATNQLGIEVNVSKVSVAVVLVV